jgi:putative spermidine/putrescine transport system permease protein
MFLTAKISPISKGRVPLWPFLPLVLPWGLLLGGGLFTLLQSFDLMNPLAGSPGLGAYKKTLGDPFFWESLLFTLVISLLTAFLATGIGLMLALWFSRLRGMMKRSILIYKFFLILPHISVAYLTIILFSRTGLMSSFLFKLKLINDYRDFPILIFDNRGIGIVLGYLIKETPFALLMISALLANIPEEMISTAQMLGASPLFTARKIQIPQALPAVNSSFFILFLYTFGAFEIPFILGGSKPVMLSIAVYNRLFRLDFTHRAEAMVMLIAMALVNIASVLILIKLNKLFRGGKSIL